ncbi:MAG: hypothetical protein ACRD82_02800 [Blastocatellia bacterium]
MFGITPARFAVILFALCYCLGFGQVQAQTSSFTYQGRLTEGGGSANGSYDLEFKLFDALTGGAQVGTTNSLANVAVAGGVFSVTLDFGAAAFPGVNRHFIVGLGNVDGAFKMYSLATTDLVIDLSGYFAP